MVVNGARKMMEEEREGNDKVGKMKDEGMKGDDVGKSDGS